MANNPLLGSFGDVSGSGLMFRNKLINGAMVIDQRNAGASKTPIDGEYLLDRWKAGVSAASKFSVQQVSTAPVGFSNSLQCTSLSAYSVTTNDNFEIFQLIEGFNTFDLSFGTANAKTITLSFWVRSSLTGTFGGSILNSAFNRSYPFSYTISAANTWEYKTITIPGDTSGTWIGATNGAGLILCLGLGAGSGRSGTAGSWSGSTFYNATGATSLVGTNGATILFSGVQLEAGPQATPFEQRPVGMEMSLCHRYCRVFGGAKYSKVGVGGAQTTTTAYLIIQFPGGRIANSAVLSGPWKLSDDAASIVATGLSLDALGTDSNTASVAVTVASGLTLGKIYFLIAANDETARITLSAEL